MKYHYHKDGSGLSDSNQVFVFGSNTAGIHMGGAAKAAIDHYGAKRGKGEGNEGQSYAIPTLAVNLEGIAFALKKRMLVEIKESVHKFIKYADDHPEIQFFVTRIGCGIAGYEDKEIAPMFKSAPVNCSFAEEWKEFVEPDASADSVCKIICEFFEDDSILKEGIQAGKTLVESGLDSLDTVELEMHLEVEFDLDTLELSPGDTLETIIEKINNGQQAKIHHI